MNIPICCICYNRIDSIKRLLLSLEKADYNGYSPTLIISIDKSDTQEVEKFADKYKWPYGNKIVYKHEANLGLRNHVLECGNRIKDYDGLVVLEDDILVAPSFYHYAQQAVSCYFDDGNIAGISLYSFRINYQTQTPFIPLHGNSDIYFMKCAQSWGQVWIKERWMEFYDWYTNNNNDFENDGNLPESICRWPKSSWLKYHTRYCIENNKYFVYPYIALSSNNSDAGTHVGLRNTLFQVPLQYGVKMDFKFTSFDDNNAIKYDGFFESENLFKQQDGSNSITVSLYGTKKINKKNLFLSASPLPFRIVKSWAMNLRPIELNILMEQNGNEIFLYDPSATYNPPTINKVKVAEYVWNYPSISSILKHIGIFNLLMVGIKHITRKIRC